MVKFMSEMNILIYEGKKGTRVDLKSLDLETMWATVKQIAEIFDCTTQNVEYHAKRIFETGELIQNSVTKKILVTASDGKNYDTIHYNLDMIIAVGYGINSSRATQFRIWATKILKEYIIKGFAMDDERLKDPSRNQYFDELLARIRDIRASEKLFYQKIKDIYKTAIDYEENKNSDEAREFFKIVQNKMLFAICGKTAADLIVSRINAKDKNLGLTSFQGSVVRKKDIDIAKNYLNKEEIERLNRLTMMLLEYAEDQAQRGRVLAMADWKNKLDNLIAFNDYEVLKTAGKISHDNMEKIVSIEYKKFDEKRKEVEKKEAEKEALKDLEEIEKEVKEKIQSGKFTNNAKKKRDISNEENLNNPNAEKDLERFALAKPKKKA
jgi:hypothetical protein